MLDIKLKLKAGHTSQRAWMTPSPLRQLCWNVTYACNHRCPVCFTDSALARPDELTTAEALQLVRDAHAEGVRDFIISGGEPFLRNDLLDVLQFMGELGISARIASNGSLLTDAVLRRLRESTLTKSFQVSLDTLEPGLYGRIHGVPPAQLHVALDSLRRIQDHGFHTTISTRLTPTTLPGIPALLHRAREEGWATVTIHFPIHTQRADDGYRQDEDFFSLLGPVFDCFVALSEQWLVETYIPWAPYHPVVKALEKRVTVVHRGCRAGRDRLTVHPTGNVSPCVCLDAAAGCVGNIRHNALGRLFNESPICRMLQRPGEYGLCADCANVATCGAGCRAAALALTGRIDGMDGSCPFRRQGPPP